MFSCKNCQIANNIYFREHLRTTASALPRIYKTSSSDFCEGIVFCIIKYKYLKLLLRAIWKSPHRHLGISIDIDVGIGIGIEKKLFFLRSFYFCPSNFLMKKASMVKSFSSTLAHLPGSFSRCLE